MSRVQWEIVLGTLFITITGAILLYVGINEDNRMAEFVAYQSAQEIEVGAGLFEINCRGCHGPRGEGVLGLGPPLNDEEFFTQRISAVGWQGDLENYIIATVSSGRQLSTRPSLYPGAGPPAMPTWSDKYGGPLRTDQIESISAFILNWESTAMGDSVISDFVFLPPSGEDQNDPLVRGRNVYDQNGCGGCHSIESISVGAVGPTLNGIAEIVSDRVDGLSAADYLEKSINDPTAYIVDGYQDIMPKTFGETISESELSDLVEFLLSR